MSKECLVAVNHKISLDSNVSPYRFCGRIPTFRRDLLPLPSNTEGGSTCLLKTGTNM